MMNKDVTIQLAINYMILLTRDALCSCYYLNSVSGIKHQVENG